MRTAINSFLFLVVSLVCIPVLAQSGPLDEKQKAVISFEFQMDKVRGSALADAMNMEEQMSQWAASEGEEMPDPSTVEKVWGALSAPGSIQEAQGLMMGQLPMEFYLKIKFKDATSAAKAMKGIKKGGQEFEQDGKTYYRPPEDADAPENMCMHMANDTTLEFGTDKYIFLADRNVFTAGLETAWGKVPDEALKIAIDLEGASGLISEAVEMGKQGGDPMMGAYLDLVDNMKDLRLSMDVSGANLLTLHATGVSESDAEELQGGLDGLLGMAKMGGTMQVNQLKQQDPESAAVLEEILGSLKANREGADVGIVIPKPAKFEETVKKLSGM